MQFAHNGYYKGSNPLGLNFTLSCLSLRDFYLNKDKKKAGDAATPPSIKEGGAIML
jgi:hypothetical protein